MIVDSRGNCAAVWFFIFFFFILLYCIIDSKVQHSEKMWFYYLLWLKRPDIWVPANFFFFLESIGIWSQKGKTTQQPIEIYIPNERAHRSCQRDFGINTDWWWKQSQLGNGNRLKWRQQPKNKTLSGPISCHVIQRGRKINTYRQWKK